MDARGIEPKETVPASRKLGRETAMEMAQNAGKIFVAKGRKVTELAGGSTDDDTLSAMLGPTGNLRAPAARSGKTVLIGFNEEVWADFFG